MGMSTDAILVYGVALKNEDESYDTLPFAEAGDEEFEGTLARLAGAPEWGDDEFDDVYEQRKAAVDASGLTVVTHCAYDYPMYILGIKSTHKHASRGNPIVFESMQTPSAEEVKELTDFMKAHGIEGAVNWVLCSVMG